MPKSTKTFPTQADKDRYANNTQYYFSVEVPGKIVSMPAATRTKAIEMLDKYTDVLSAVFLPNDYKAIVQSGIPVPAEPAKK
jgi:hypothetical protein